MTSATSVFPKFRALALGCLALSFWTLSAKAAPLDGFFEKLLNAKDAESPVVISWYGDSAIVSDGYTSTVREALQSRFGDAGPGFILAMPSFEGYLRRGVRLKRSNWTTQSVIHGSARSKKFGYGGVVATGYSGASSTFISEKPVSSVDIFLDQQSENARLEVYGDGKLAATLYSEDKGDHTQSFHFESPVKELRIRVKKGLFSVYGVVLNRDEKGIQLDALGILGMRAKRWLSVDPDHMRGQMDARQSTLLVLNFGGNERVDPQLSVKAHQEDISLVLERLQNAESPPACLIVGPLLHGTWQKGRVILDPQLALIYEAQRAVAKEKNCAFLDTMALMQENGESVDTWRKKGWLSKDYAHLTSRGHEELGKRIAKWFEQGFDAYLAQLKETLAPGPYLFP